jgi:hydroxysqualene dehydroxylase
VKPTVAVIGAGWAGLTCALELCAAGFAPTLFEANKTPGGRARRVLIPSGATVDNGQHLLLGAYSESLRQLRAVHGTNPLPLHRIPLTLLSTKKYTEPPDIAMVSTGFPLVSLAAAMTTAHGLTIGEKASLAWFMLKTLYGEPPRASATVGEVIASVSAKPRQRILEPLCLAALNTPASRASAAVFANVLRGSFRGAPTNAEMLIPAVDLSAFFPEPACAKIAQQGGTVRLGDAVMMIDPEGAGIRVTSRKVTGSFEHVVVAVAPQHAARLLRPVAQWARTGDLLADISYEPITTVTDRTFTDDAYKSLPLLMGVDDPIGQWVFHDAQRKQRTLVVSGGDAHGDRVLSDLIGYAGAMLGVRPTALHGITEKRATYSCTPAQHVRLSTFVRPKPPLWLCGDYCYPEFPATLEAAARSGRAVANAIISLNQ